jgi:SAM-dependent methyltransferase
VNPAKGDDLKSIYEKRFSGSEEYRRKVWHILVSDWFSRFIPPDGAVLDLGCGYGEFINQVRGPARYAMDLNPNSRQFLHSDVRLFEQDCSTHWPLPDNTLDLVFTSNFFEHLPSKAKLEETLKEAWRCLRPEGRIIALGPNIKYVSGAYWDFWDHYLPLTEASMAEGFQLAGFRIEQKISRFLPYTMSDGAHYPLIILRAYLRLPFIWLFFGQQFVVIARK